MHGVKDLTEGPIGKQLYKLALPIMGTSFLQMAYSLMDMAWVGRLGSEAVAAIGAVGILVWTTSAISYLNKVASEVAVGQSVGTKNIEEAKTYASHNITISLAISLVWSILLFFFARPILGLFKLEPAIWNAAISYLRIVATAFPFVFMIAAFTGIYNAVGQSKTPFYITGIGLCLNMVLDPLFVLGFGWGIEGAGIATWLSEAVVVLIFIYQLKVRGPLMGGFPFFTKLKHDYVVRIFKLGTPVTLFSVLFSFINLFMARTASLHGGHIGLMTLTAGSNIESIAWSTTQGFATALSTFVAQNYAAKKTERLNRVYRISTALAVGFGTLMTCVYLFYGTEIFSILVPERAAYEAGGVYLFINAFSMIFLLTELTTQGLFYGTGRTVPPAVISVSLNLVRIPLAVLLANNGWGIEGVWWAISFSSILKGISSFVWFRLIKKKLFNMD
ncbi:MAG: MATE family efflux transporter [Massilibacteroides sp.]|nr:MATE family efflux transporter [Massilibacteroides sp.]